MAGFQKKAPKKLPSIPGTQQSVKTFQVLITSGIPSLDGIIGGGYPLGTLTLLESCLDGGLGSDYSKVMVNHFLSSGNQISHDIFAVNCANRPFDRSCLVASSPTVSGKASTETSAMEEEDMKIAWRYKNQEDTKSHFKVKEGKTLIEESGKIDNDVSFWNVRDIPDPLSEDDLYKTMFREINRSLDSPKYVLENNPATVNVMRIAITDLDSPMMSGDIKDLIKMLFALKSLVRHKLAVAVISLSLPDTLSPENLHNLKKIRELCDFCLQLEGFDKVKAKKLQQHGFFTVKKLPSIKTLKCPLERSYGKYYFKSTRTKFMLERIHLPPELEEQGRTSTAPKKDLHSVSQDW